MFCTENLNQYLMLKVNSQKRIRQNFDKHIIKLELILTSTSWRSIVVATACNDKKSNIYIFIQI